MLHHHISGPEKTPMGRMMLERKLDWALARQVSAVLEPREIKRERIPNERQLCPV